MLLCEQKLKYICWACDGQLSTGKVLCHPFWPPVSALICSQSRSLLWCKAGPGRFTKKGDFGTRRFEGNHVLVSYTEPVEGVLHLWPHKFVHTAAAQDFVTCFERGEGHLVGEHCEAHWARPPPDTVSVTRTHIFYRREFYGRQVFQSGILTLASCPPRNGGVPQWLATLWAECFG